MTSQTQPIELYYSAAPNGRKITVMLEELGVPWNMNYISFSRREQFSPEFLAISPNNKIPVITDPEGPDGAPITIFESGAILKYLGLKFGRLYPTEPRAQVAVDEWLFWQVGGFGPMLGQAHHFLRDAPEKLPYAMRRYQEEAYRLYRVLNARLAGRDFVAGDYSIADIAILGWAHRHPRHNVSLPDYPEVDRWYTSLLARPAVARALAIPDPE